MKPQILKEPTLPANPKIPTNTKAVEEDLKLAWREAEAAFLRFKETRDSADRERAAGKVYEVALREAKIIVKRNVDTLLPAHMRRDKDEMASNVRSSVFSRNAMRPSVLAETFDPERASLRTLVSNILYNKVIDYVRREPIPGVVGPGVSLDREQINHVAGSNLATGDAESSLDADVPNLRAFIQMLAIPGSLPRSAKSNLSTVIDASEGAEDGSHWGAARGGVAPERAHSDDHATLQILERLTQFLAPDEVEVFACEFQEMTRPEGLAHLNERHGPREGPDGKLHPYMSLSAYNRKLCQARDKLARHFPDCHPRSRQ